MKNLACATSRRDLLGRAPRTQWAVRVEQKHMYEEMVVANKGLANCWLNQIRARAEKTGAAERAGAHEDSELAVRQND